MNTAEINKILSTRLGKTQKETRGILDIATGVIENTLVSDKHFTIPGLGTFGTKIKTARNAFNPALKKIVQLPASKAVFFHPSSGLKREINKGGLNG